MVERLIINNPEEFQILAGLVRKDNSNNSYFEYSMQLPISFTVESDPLFITAEEYSLNLSFEFDKGFKNKIKDYIIKKSYFQIKDFNINLKRGTILQIINIEIEFYKKMNIEDSLKEKIKNLIEEINEEYGYGYIKDEEIEL
jgi:hypothetical protein